MALIIFGSISILFLISFSVTKRKIHLFECIILWGFILSLQNNYIWLTGINLKLLTLPTNLQNHWAYISVRSVIVPIVIMLFLEQTPTFEETWKKILYWLGTISILVGIEYLTDLFKIIHFSEKWKFGYSFANWSSVVLFSFLIHKLIRHFARKDGLI
ncbi:CBO0543 family protein [Bacillus sp. CGMCC 1.16607]|uniref:CBO0543 family protein n=1 Tax=Bacillus sp. CGMCC 1.16607 TaxID=3351842 RepID=UPI003631FE65